nr:CYP360A5 protein [Diaphanosoma celebensis]
MDPFSLISSYPTLLLVAIASFVFYWYGTRTHDFFSSQGIPGPKPIPFIGNMWGMWRKNVAENDIALYKKYGKIFGIYEGVVPNLFVTDPKLIRSILIKDSGRFINRRDFTLRAQYLRKMVTVVRDQEWKDIRSAVTPTFTIGKIKKMSVLMKQCADSLSNRFAVLAETRGQLDAKDEFCTYPVDVISTCAYATKLDLDDEENLFVTNAKKVLISPVTKSPMILSLVLFPRLIKALRSRIMIIKEYEYFRDLVLNVIRERTKSSEKFNDFIEMAYEAFSRATVEGTSKPKWTREQVDEMVTGQCIVFLFAGFDSVSTTLTATSFLLATHPEIQEKLYQLIVEKFEQYGDVCHEMVVEIPYLDQILNESLRLYSPAPRLERECNQDVTYDGVHIKKGTLVTVPIYAVHHSEEFYPEPEKFDPDRWDPANDNQPNPYSFLSFGFGPRNCAGMKFAQEEIKIALCTLLRKFEFYPVAETPDKLHMDFGFLIGNQPTNAVVGIKLRQGSQ